MYDGKTSDGKYIILSLIESVWAEQQYDFYILGKYENIYIENASLGKTYQCIAIDPTGTQLALEEIC